MSAKHSRSRRRVRRNPSGLLSVGTDVRNTIIGLASTISMALSAYHGYKRNTYHSPVLWSIAWGALGAVFPVITPVIAIAEGFAKPLPPTMTITLPEPV